MSALPNDILRPCRAISIVEALSLSSNNVYAEELFLTFPLAREFSLEKINHYISEEVISIMNSSESEVEINIDRLLYDVYGSLCYNNMIG